MTAPKKDELGAPLRERYQNEFRDAVISILTKEEI